MISCGGTSIETLSIILQQDSVNSGIVSPLSASKALSPSPGNGQLATFTTNLRGGTPYPASRRNDELPIGQQLLLWWVPPDSS